MKGKTLNTGRTWFKKGSIPWNKGIVGYSTAWKGRHQSDNTKSKISKAKKGTTSSWNKGMGQEKIICGFCGCEFYAPQSHHRRFCSRKCVESRTPWNKDKQTGSLTREHIRKVLRRRPMSGLEQKVDKVIQKYGLPYKFVGNGNFFIERKNPDFVNTNGKKIAIEVYWKRHKEMIRHLNVEQWMSERKQIFSKYGWDIIFIEGTGLNEKTILDSLQGGQH